MSLTPITSYDKNEEDMSSESSETHPQNTNNVQEPDINNELKNNDSEILSEENEDKVENPIQNNNIANTSDSPVSDNREYYIRVARTLVIILVTILFIYFVNWLLVNVFKIDLYQMLKDKMMTIPVLGSICASIAASSWFKKSDSDSEKSSTIFETGNSESVPVSISRDTNTDITRDTVFEDDIL